MPIDEQTRVMDAARRILYSAETIEQRIIELAQDISRDYAGKDVEIGRAHV